MSVPHYEVHVRWSDEDAVFIAEVPDLPGCAAHGATPAEAAANATDAAEAWIASAIEGGIVVPAPTRRTTQRV